MLFAFCVLRVVYVYVASFTALPVIHGQAHMNTCIFALSYVQLKKIFRPAFSKG